jgi:hypothetical protein
MEIAMRQPQKKTVAKDHSREVHALRSRYGVQPLEFMLMTINNDKLPIELRCAMAVAAAPYLHPKLKAREIDDVATPEQGGLDISKVSDEDLHQLDRIFMKYT